VLEYCYFLVERIKIGMTNEGTVTSVKDVKPGQKNLSMIFIVLEIGKVHQVCSKCRFFPQYPKRNLFRNIHSNAFS